MEKRIVWYGWYWFDCRGFWNMGFMNICRKDIILVGKWVLIIYKGIIIRIEW